MLAKIGRPEPNRVIHNGVSAVEFEPVASDPSATDLLFVGELRRLNDVFAARGVNIAAQYYQTDADIGYVVLDADGAVADADDILAEIRANPGTIRARLVHRL